MADLGIDSASNVAGVAVLDGGRVLSERRWTVQSNYSRELLGGIDELLRAAGVARDELRSIAVAVGPGGYSGLRTGVATAQGMALALGIPLAGVSALELAAFPHLRGASGGLPVVAVHDPGRGTLSWAAYGSGAEGDGPEGDDAKAVPVLLTEPRVDPAEDCARLAPAPALWCGDLTEVLAEARAGAGRVGDREVAPAANVRSAADVVRLAGLHQAYVDPEQVDVLYLRPPNITRPRIGPRTVPRGGRGGRRGGPRGADSRSRP